MYSLLCLGGSKTKTIMIIIELSTQMEGIVLILHVKLSRTTGNTLYVYALHYLYLLFKIT